MVEAAGGTELQILGVMTKTIIIGQHMADITGYVVKNLLGGSTPLILGLQWMMTNKVTLNMDKMSCSIRRHGLKTTFRMGRHSHLPGTTTTNGLPTPEQVSAYCLTRLHANAALHQLPMDYQVVGMKQIEKEISKKSFAHVSTC